MCGAYGFTKQQAREYWQRRYELERFPEHDWHSFNIRPTQESYVVVRRSPNRVIKLRFGIEAPWNPKMLLINAQSETVAEKRTFKKMFLESRCLVIADVFYEWKRLSDGKQPYAFSLKDGEVMSFAGICNDEGFVILTTKPNKTLEDVHNRMPCILSREDEDEWLNPDTPEEKLLDMLHPFPDAEMKKWAISSLVNSAKNDIPEILKPVSDNN